MDKRNTREPRYWSNPPMSTIRLLTGEEVQAHVNGTSFDDPIGFALVNGQTIVVKQWTDGEWYEEKEA